MRMGQEQERVDACDVVVVGAGLTGAAVAARLVREGFDTAVLEAQTTAGGATGRSAGMVLTGLAGHYNWAVATYGRQKAQNIWALTTEGRERLVETAGQLGIPVEQTGSLALAVDDAEVEALEESASLLQEDGFNVQFSPNDPLERDFRAAIQCPDDVVVDANALTWALLDTSNLAVHEGTEVHDLEPDKNGVRVWAHSRTVLCNTVVLAVNGYAPLLDSYFTDKVIPTRALIVATEPLDKTVLEQPCYADYGYEYCRQLPDRRLLMGSWRRPHHPHQKTKQDTEQGNVVDMVEEGLLRFASRHFPSVETLDTSRRSGIMGFTPDGLPLVGRLPDLPQVYFAVGLGGRGLTWAFAIAERLVASMQDDTDPGLGLFGQDEA
ncbi:MAG: FAD-dependent oxidoreductase [Chloroflexota bacterium]|nr:FAD-dependent oxidoreductase [Chloroflexota bacterium]